MRDGSRGDRLALGASVALVAINLATTARWAAVPGALRGWRWPFVLVALVLSAAAALLPPRDAWRCPRWLSLSMLVAGVSALAALFLVVWFPPPTWTQIPFLDDWPPRFSSTVEGLTLLRRGAFAGWQWNLLGGYATATDITQSLTLVGALPMALFGPAIGFHVLHLALFLAVPSLVYVDLRRSESREVAGAAAGWVAFALCNFSWMLIRSGDTNSLSGLVGVLATLAASHRARQGARFGFTVLVIAMAVTAYSHVGFFAYGCAMLIVEAVYYRDWRHAVRATLAGACAVLISLPLTFELFRYPGEFQSNNVLFRLPDHLDWPGILRKIGYNVQLLFLPHRWFGDLAKLFGPIVLLVAWRREGRAGFYAWAAAAAVALTFFNVPEAGYLFARPVILAIAFTPIALASFVTTRSAGLWQTLVVTALVALCVPIVNVTVPHAASVAEFAPAVTARVASSDGALVLVENNPHRPVDNAPDHVAEPSLYGTHYEALLPWATGKRLYAGYWDGWQWTPFRGEMLASGAWQAHTLTTADKDAFLAELRRWGIRHALVWSNASKAALVSWPEMTVAWQDGPWRDFELTAAPVDTRSVVSDHGRGELAATDPLGGRVSLVDVRAGDRVIVRTHFHPAWSAASATGTIATVDMNGQLGFIAPADGTYDVTLIYPPRRWLLGFAALVVLLVGVRDWVTARPTR